MRFATGAKGSALRLLEQILEQGELSANWRDDPTSTVKRTEQSLESKAQSAHPSVECLTQPAFERLHLAQERISPRDDDLGGVRRSRRTNVGNQVGDGDIDLVTDAADDGHAARRDRSGHGFVVEGPEVLCRAAAARDDDDV